MQVVNTIPNNPSTTFGYGYDAAGNRTSDSTATYAINDVNEITNTGYAWDLNGNMTSDGVRTFSWDAANRLTTIIYPNNSGRSEFTYDGLGRRVQIIEKDKTGVVQVQNTFVWNGMSIAEQRDSTGTTVIKRFLAEGVQIPANASPNSKLFYSKDHLGSVRSLTNESGAILSTVDYDAYGSISRAPVPANDTSGAGPTLVSAASRIMHGSYGPFDVNLPLTGAPGIEMRSPGSGNYTLILSFDRTVLAATSTSIASGVATVSGLASFSGNTATVQLTGVADRQTVIVELDNVTGIVGVTAKAFVAVSFLKGDVNQDGAVTPEDVFLVRASTATNPTASTFPRDVNANGVIDSGDVFVDRQADGDSLFPDFAFTGHYYHARSGLYLAPYRAYNPSIGRWLSRDPIGELGGTNLYGYTKNNPSNAIDPLGLDAIVLIAPTAILGQGHIAILVGNNSTGWTYYSRNGYGAGPFGFATGNSVLKTYPTYQDFKADIPEASRYRGAYHIETSADEDLAMTTYGDEHYRDSYHSIKPPSNNCADLTEEILEAGNHPVPGLNQYPLEFYGIHIGSPEVPNLMFLNLLNSGMGHAWNVFP
jgi:RHS repeat-associated protein